VASGVAGSATVTVSATANAIANGGFEGGTLAPWTASGASERVVGSGYPCHGGSACAQLGLSTPTNGNSNISQSFKAPSGSSSVAFYYYLVCTDTVSYDWATATLKDTTTNTTYTVLGRTCTNNKTWSKASYAVTPGHSYTLTLTNRDDNYPGDPTYTLYDDVVVQ
jgi:serine protease